MTLIITNAPTEEEIIVEQPLKGKKKKVAGQIVKLTWLT
jgi:hypothetical protein